MGMMMNRVVVPIVRSHKSQSTVGRGDFCYGHRHRTQCAAGSQWFIRPQFDMGDEEIEELIEVIRAGRLGTPGRYEGRSV